MTPSIENVELKADELVKVATADVEMAPVGLVVTVLLSGLDDGGATLRDTVPYARMPT